MEEYQVEKPKFGRMKIILLVGVLIAVVAAVFASFYLTKAYRPASHDSQPVSFSVESGTSTKRVASNLEEQKLISSSNVFLAYAYFHDASGKIQAGEYELSASMSIAEITDVLTRGKVIPSDRSITVLEGWTNAQIANDLEERGLIESADDFESVVMDGEFNFRFKEVAEKFKYEGFLYPDTYKINRNGTAEELVRKMFANFDSKVTDEMISDIEKSGKNLEDVIILASIIEKEVGRNKANLTDEDLELMQQERRLVASVFYNRLEVGMGLESDATVNYITGKGMRSVTIADTKIDSPYNTYRYKGLPPGPISNPSLNSIMAAIYPADSDYLYFLNSPEGTAYYGRTLEEHGQNREKYLR